MTLAAILANWKNFVMGGLALACALLFGLWKMEELKYADDKLAQVAAIKKAQDKADSLSQELEAAQAKALAAISQKETVYVDWVKSAPDDRQRLRAASDGMRAILRGDNP